MNWPNSGALFTSIVRSKAKGRQSQPGDRSGRGKLAEHQFARRSLLIRRMTTTPSSDQSKLIAPPSWAAILRCTNWLPKPSSFVGAATGGPPRSVHLTTTSSSSSWALHDTSRVPLDSDSAPYSQSWWPTHASPGRALCWKPLPRSSWGPRREYERLLPSRRTSQAEQR